MIDRYPVPDFLHRQPAQPAGARERPILFSSSMVRAILAGSKTQTRRVTKPQPGEHIWTDSKTGLLMTDIKHKYGASTAIICPYGQPGDRLWVREAWRPNWTIEHGHVIEFAADNAVQCFNGCCNDMQVIEPGYSWLTSNYDCYLKPWRRSIHMHRWASRILLEITAVRVERLNEISGADARAEGCPDKYVDGAEIASMDAMSREWYGQLWESINGAGSWSANPWVWCLTFKRV